MHIISGLSIQFTGEFIFKDISFTINDKDRIGLVGRNGAGKSTLMKILAGREKSYTGSVSSPNAGTVGYLPQEIYTDSTETIFNEALTAYEDVLKLEASIKKYTEEIANRTDYHSDSYLKLIEKLNEANEQYQLKGGFSIEGNTEKILLGLGFEKSDFTKSIQTFSGGWKMRVELAKLLLRSPDLLLLDEPTNHLDIISIEWLEQFLMNYQGAVMLVSHDRAFLDHVTNRTVEISQGSIYDFKTSYSNYVSRRAEIRSTQMAAYNNQQKMIAETERFIERFRYKSTKAKQVQSRIKKLDKLEEVQVDTEDLSHIAFSFPPAPHCGKIVFEAKHLSKSFGEKEVLKDLNFAIKKNDFIAFVGKNGEGKSTLSKIITGHLNYEGEAIIGHQVEIGYYAQNQTDMLDEQKTVFQTIDDEAIGDLRKKVKAILGSFLFRDDDLEKKVSVLSGGEKARLALAKLLLKPVNLLVLDEPTNHLDMVSKDILKKALLEYTGTLIIVSHDRDFLHNLTDNIYEVQGHHIKLFPGDVYEYLEKKKMLDLDALNTKKKIQSEVGEKKVGNGKANYLQKKAEEKEKRKLKNQINKLEAQIEDIEEGLENINEILTKGGPDIPDNIYADYEILQKELEEKMEEWERLNKNL